MDFSQKFQMQRDNFVKLLLGALFKAECLFVICFGMHCMSR